MLTHKITKHAVAPPVVVQNTANQWHVKGHLNKHEYAMMLSHLPFKKGDILISKHIVADETLRAPAFFLVQDVQEIHYMCEYERFGGELRPKCLHLINCNKAHFWTTHDNWKLATPEQLVASDVTKAFNADAQNSPLQIETIYY